MCRLILKRMKTSITTGMPIKIPNPRLLCTNICPADYLLRMPDVHVHLDYRPYTYITPPRYSSHILSTTITAGKVTPSFTKLFSLTKINGSE